MFSLQLPRRDERGFMLIELLVVIIIIGILAAIAIPLFLDQRKLAVDASVKSDVRNTATQVQTWLVTNPGAIATDAADYTSQGGKVSSSTGDTVKLSVATDGSYLVCGYAGTAAKAYTASTAAYVFDSTTGRFGLGDCANGIVGAGSPSSSASPSTTASTPATPGASFTATPANLNVNLDATGSTNVNGTTPYTWSYGDGSANQSTGTGTNSHTYATAGTYTVTLTVKNGDTGPTASTTRTFTVTAPAPLVSYNFANASKQGWAYSTIGTSDAALNIAGRDAYRITGSNQYGLGSAQVSFPTGTKMVQGKSYTLSAYIYLSQPNQYATLSAGSASTTAISAPLNTWIYVSKTFTNTSTGGTYISLDTNYNNSYTSGPIGAAIANVQLVQND